MVPFGSFTVSIQKMHSTLAALALGPPAAPCRNAILEVPPPVVGGLSGVVETRKVVVEMMFCPAIAWLSTLLGLSTIACVTPGISACGVRNWLGVARLLSGKWIGSCGGSIVNGVIETGAIGGA